MTFRLILDGPLGGAENMGRDVLLLDAAREEVASARVYSWRKTCVSLGKNQSPERALIDPSRTPWVERPTGGKAVLHGHDVTVSIAVPVDGRPDLHAIYRRWTTPILEACEGLGLEMTLGENPTDAEGEDCFAETGRFDFVDRDGIKRAGCAMRVSRGGALLQASIPCRAPEVDADALIVGGRPSPPVLAWRSEGMANALAAALRGPEEKPLRVVRGRHLSDRAWRSAVLFNEWDPIGVKDTPFAWDEYEDYVTADSVEALRRHRREMGTGGPERAEAAFARFSESGQEASSSIVGRP